MNELNSANRTNSGPEESRRLRIGPGIPKVECPVCLRLFDEQGSYEAHFKDFVEKGEPDHKQALLRWNGETT